MIINVMILIIYIIISSSEAYSLSFLSYFVALNNYN